MSIIFLYAELDLFAAVILSLLLLSLRSNSARMPDDRLFRDILLLVITILLVDIGCWSVNGRSGAMALNCVVNVIYFVLSGLICWLWLLYADYTLFAERAFFAPSRRQLLSGIPFALQTVFSILSPWAGWYFFVDSNNVYHRGPLFILQVLLCWSYVAAAAVMTLCALHKSRDRHRRRKCISLLTFAVLPLTGSLLQSLYYGLALVWICASVSLVLIFLNVQGEQISMDALTGVNNRGRLNKFLAIKLSADPVPQDERLYLLLLDVDLFKAVNDRRGHVVGDAVLIYLADLLKTICAGERRNDFLARYGGDEFAIVCQRESDTEVAALAESIRQQVKAHFLKKDAPCPITVSVGCAVFDPAVMNGADDLISAADFAMYADKNKRGELF